MIDRRLFAVLAIIFVGLAPYRFVRGNGHWEPATMAWTIIAIIFAIVSGLLVG